MLKNLIEVLHFAADDKKTPQGRSNPSSGSSRPPKIVNAYRRETDVSSSDDELSTDESSRPVILIHTN